MICVPKAEWMAIEARSRAFDLADLAGENDQNRDDHPRPPAVHEMEQVQIVGQREPTPCDQSMPSGNEAAVHVGPGVGDIAGAEARDPGAEHELDEQDRERERAPAGQPRRPRRGSGDGRRSSAVQISAREQEQREQQMGRQAIGADLGPAFEPGHHHEPADRALQPAEDEQRASRQP